MDNIVYHRVIPENLKDSYKEFDQVDYLLSFEGRKMVLGSLRIEGEVEVLKGASPMLNHATDNLQLDGMVGAHSFFESFTTSIQSGANVVENLTEYPRYAKMVSTATSGRSDMNNANNVCEMKAPLDQMTTGMLVGISPNTQIATPIHLNPDFSIKPLICVNSGSGSISSRKSGDIRLSFQLVRNNGALFGNDNDGTYTYNLKDLRVRFISVPDDGSNDSIVLKTKQNIKQSIQSSFANIQTKVGSRVSGVSISFQKQINENTATHNNLTLDKVPNLSQTQFLFNDSTNTLITYLIKSYSEVVDRYIDSFMDTGRNKLSLQDLANNDGFGVGLDFGQILNFENNKFSLQLNSGVSSASPLIAYMYFHSFIEL